MADGTISGGKGGKEGRKLKPDSNGLCRSHENQDSQKIQLDSASVCVARIDDFSYENKFPGWQSGFTKISIRIKYNYIGLQYV